MTDATYTMGDGETPHFAEGMALERVKQSALEQAGTYVESYTQIGNLEVTVDEIRAIAGGALETEVIEKNRTLFLRYRTIKADRLDAAMARLDAVINTPEHHTQSPLSKLLEN